ncbi:MAG: SDR family NAD(P)-dependent oxidoreductase [Hyphomicrobiales bacterium]|nr:MAG: SDR family NAD(P)-dependent oxidoreductase [Hyphomicrobiales bacterium]
MNGSLLARWRRRWWRPDPTALSAYEGLRPITLITGGSEGIGFALAQRFASHGHELLLVARTAEKLAQAQRALAATSRAQVHTLALDITSDQAIERIDAELRKLGGLCDVLVNCAGIGLSGPFADEPEEKVTALVDLNVRALTRLTSHYLRPMLVRGEGGILNLASVGSYGPGPNQAAYYASKAYVLSLTEAIGYETAGMGIRVCALAPGPVRTGFHARMGARRALYRAFTPPVSPALVAWLGFWGYRLGARVVWPGLVTPLAALSMRLIPHRLLNPIVSTLLSPRR